MALNGFTTFNFTEGVPSVSVTNNGLTFNRSVMVKLGNPEYVVLLINEDARQIAIQVCPQETPNAVQFCKEGKVGSVRWNIKDLLNTISGMMSWDLLHSSYRVEGTLLKDDAAVLFDLNNASPLL